MRIKPRWVLSWNPRQVMSSIMRRRKGVAGVGKKALVTAGCSCSVEGTSIIRAQTNSFNKSRNQPRSMPPAYHAQTSRGAGSFSVKSFGRSWAYESVLREEFRALLGVRKCPKNESLVLRAVAMGISAEGLDWWGLLKPGLAGLGATSVYGVVSVST